MARGAVTWFDDHAGGAGRGHRGDAGLVPGGADHRGGDDGGLGPWAVLDATIRAALAGPAACPFCGDPAPDALGELIVSLAIDTPAALDGGCADCGTPLPRRLDGVGASGRPAARRPGGETEPARSAARSRR